MGETNFQSQELSFLNIQNFHLRGDSKNFEGPGRGPNLYFFHFPPRISLSYVYMNTLDPLELPKLKKSRLTPHPNPRCDVRPNLTIHNSYFAQ